VRCAQHRDASGIHRWRQLASPRVGTRHAALRQGWRPGAGRWLSTAHRLCPPPHEHAHSILGRRRGRRIIVDRPGCRAEQRLQQVALRPAAAAGLVPVRQRVPRYRAEPSQRLTAPAISSRGLAAVRPYGAKAADVRVLLGDESKTPLRQASAPKAAVCWKVRLLGVGQLDLRRQERYVLTFAWLHGPDLDCRVDESPATYAILTL